MDGDIPSTVTQGMANTFRRYGAQLVDTLELQNKLTSNALSMRQHFNISGTVWNTQIRKWYKPIKDVCIYT